MKPTSHADSSSLSRIASGSTEANRTTRTPSHSVPIRIGQANDGDAVERGPSTTVQTTAGQRLITQGGTEFDGIRVQRGDSNQSDSSIAVGPNHIVQILDGLYSIYSKNGARLLGPGSIQSLWAGIGGQCAADASSDATVQYDSAADRWTIVQHSSLSTSPTECVAVSRTSDPSDAYSLYSYSFESKLNDRPSFGVWPTATNSAYLATYNLFNNDSSFAGAQICAYDRTAMLAGAASPVRLCFAGIEGASYVPVDVDGATPPLDGTPAYFGALYSTSGSLGLYKMSADFETPSAVLSSLSHIAVASFSEASSVPQPGTPMVLDALSDRLMQRMAFRRFVDHEAIVVTHSVAAGAFAGIRWYELRAPVSKTDGFALFQQGTFAPADGNHRWMGSVSIDSAGDIALGYSASSTTLHPSQRYTGRTAADPAGAMGSEITVRQGLAPRTSSSLSHDFSSLHIDPSDDCSFWFVNEGVGLYTRIGSFKFSGCGAPQTANSLPAKDELPATSVGPVPGTASCLDIAECSSKPKPHSVVPANISKVGIFRSGFYWLEDVDGNQQFNSPPDRAFAFGGVPGDIAITGDWNGDGHTKVGVYRPSNGLFILDSNGNGQFDQGVDAVYNLGVGLDATDIPVVGDWNGDGRTKVGLFRQGFFWILDFNGNGVFEQNIDKTYAFGTTGDVPVVGDWTGTGTSKIGLLRQGFFWILDANGNGLFDGTGQGQDQAFAFGGISGDVPVVGDWNGDGRSKVGMFRQGFFWVLDGNGDHQFTDTQAGHDLAFAFGGLSGDKPIVGKWLQATIVATSGTPQSGAINTAFGGRLVATVTDSSGIGVRGTTVTFAVPGGGASATFAGNVNTAVTDASGIATSAVISANGTTGAYSVTASVPGAATPATFSLTNTGPPSTITATGGTPQSTQINTAFAAPLSVTVKDSQSVGVGGVLVTFTAPALSGASGSFAGGVNTATTNASGVATSAVFTANGNGGSYSVAASVSGVGAPANFSLTNTVPTGGAITIDSVSVGQKLQTVVGVNLATPAGPGGATVTVTTSDPSKVLVAGTPIAAGGTSVTFTISAGQTMSSIFVQGVASSGTATLVATAFNYSPGSSIVTATPSGFVLSGPNGIGVPSFSIGAGANTLLTVTSARLNASFNFAEAQAPAVGITANVAVTSSNINFGTITTSPLTFTAGTASLTTQFNAIATGNTTVTAVVPAGFSAPANSGNVLTASVTPAALMPGNATVGKGLATTTSVTLNGAAGGGQCSSGGGLTVTLTSNNPSLLLLSTNGTDGGSTSIPLCINQGLNHTPDFFVYGLGNTGSVTYTAAAPGFGSANGTVTLAPSGFILAGPGGIGVANFTTSTASSSTPINVYSALLDSGLNFVSLQQLAGGSSVNIPVTSGNTSVGTISTSPVNIGGAAFSALTQFVPVSAGSSLISVGVPTGFSTPAQDASVTANVNMPGFSVTDGITIGNTLESGASVVIGQLAGAGGQQVLLTSNNPSALKLSATATGVGTNTLMVTIPQGSNNASFFLQAFGNPSTATYTASATGFQSRTGTVQVVPSAAVIGGPFGGFPFTTTVGSQPTTLTVSMAQLDVNGNFVGTQQVAGGVSVMVSVNNSNSAVATVPSTVTVSAGTDHTNTTFTPVSQGQAIISLGTPAGYSNPPSGFGSVTGTVN